MYFNLEVFHQRCGAAHHRLCNQLQNVANKTECTFRRTESHSSRRSLTANDVRPIKLLIVRSYEAASQLTAAASLSFFSK